MVELRVSEVYSGQPGCIATARRAVTAFLARIGTDTAVRIPADTVGQAQLVVSELVTNAVQHTGGECGLQLELVADEVEITVWDTDASPAEVTVAQPDPLRVGQHGLEIVKALCGRLRVSPAPRGKQVQVRMALPLAV
ncbi:ATP-binding protein [Streptomyces sp. NPDC005551]|uniref:ATP-binding protein n=1 Tax=unclassified Streptomyces TaxID=2593676 RepID=UPI0033EEBE12